MDNERKKRQERSQLPGKKRRRLELKRITQKGANEAAEGDTYQSGKVQLQALVLD